MRESMRTLLSLNGYTAQTSKNVQEAIDALSFTVFDLILLDLHLKDQSGFDVMDYLENKQSDTRVIVFTGEQ